MAFESGMCAPVWSGSARSFDVNVREFEVDPGGWWWGDPLLVLIASSSYRLDGTSSPLGIGGLAARPGHAWAAGCRGARL